MENSSEEIQMLFSKPRIDCGGETIPKVTFFRFPDKENTANETKSQFDKHGHVSCETHEDLFTVVEEFMML